MFVYDLTFRPNPARTTKSDFERVVWEFLWALSKTHFFPDNTHTVIRQGLELVARITVPHRKFATVSRFRNAIPYQWKELAKRSAAPLTVTFVAKAATEGNYCRCRKPELLFLLPRSIASLLTCGSCHRCFALPRIPDARISEGLYFFDRKYTALVELWMRSDFGEMFAYRLLSRWNSPLTKEGLELCRDIETVMGVPTYYWLMRDYLPLLRVCPSCGGSWKLATPLDGRLIAYKCDRCRLVSETPMLTRTHVREPTIGEGEPASRDEITGFG